MQACRSVLLKPLLQLQNEDLEKAGVTRRNKPRNNILRCGWGSCESLLQLLSALFHQTAGAYFLVLVAYPSSPVCRSPSSSLVVAALLGSRRKSFCASLSDSC